MQSRLLLFYQNYSRPPLQHRHNILNFFWSYFPLSPRNSKWFIITARPSSAASHLRRRPTGYPVQTRSRVATMCLLNRCETKSLCYPPTIWYFSQIHHILPIVCLPNRWATKIRIDNSNSNMTSGKSLNLINTGFKASVFFYSVVSLAYTLRCWGVPLADPVSATHRDSRNNPLPWDAPYLGWVFLLSDLKWSQVIKSISSSSSTSSSPCHHLFTVKLLVVTLGFHFWSRATWLNCCVTQSNMY